MTAVEEARKQYPRWRSGQTYFNVLADVRPDLSEELRASALDPFHGDDRIPMFLNWLRRNWKTPPTPPMQ